MFIFVILVMYVLFWYPIIKQLNENIWKTRSLLQIIPLPIFSTLKGLKQYLRYIFDEICKSQT